MVFSKGILGNKAFFISKKSLETIDKRVISCYIPSIPIGIGGTNMRHFMSGIKDAMCRKQRVMCG